MVVHGKEGKPLRYVRVKGGDHGKESSKVNWDCTICRSCRRGGV